MIPYYKDLRAFGKHSVRGLLKDSFKFYLVLLSDSQLNDTTRVGGIKKQLNNNENLYLEIIGKHVNNYEIPPTPF
jgi:hypothetical protein